MSALRLFDQPPPELGAGAVWLRGFLAVPEQRVLAERCRQLIDAPSGGYVPTVRGGGQMHVRMLCLGRHWNGRTYTYEPTRSDFDGLPVPPVPDELRTMARAAAAAVGMSLEADVCIMNQYESEGRMGLHQDKDESPESLAAGLPVVSISLGDTARFLFGGTRRRDPVDTIPLRSGDAFVFGGPARLRYHGVSRILPGTAPAALRLEGRFNLTFRQYGT